MTWLRRRREPVSEERQVAPPLPQPGEWLQLVAGDAVFDVVVERAGEGFLTVAAGRDADSDALTAAARVSVAWPSSAGLVQVEAGSSVAAPGTWRLTLDSDSAVVQRRMYVRVPTDVRVHLRRDGLGLVRTTAADLSATGMRCDVAAGLPLNDGDRLKVSLLLNETPVTVDAEINRIESRPTVTEIALRFLDPYPADTIGRWVLGQQIRQRAERRDERDE